MRSKVSGHASITSTTIFAPNSFFIVSAASAVDSGGMEIIMTSGFPDPFASARASASQFAAYAWWLAILLNDTLPE